MSKNTLFAGGILVAVVIIWSIFSLWNSGIDEQEDLGLEIESEMVEGAADDKIDSSPSPKALPTLIDDNRFLSFLYLAREQFHDSQLAESKDSYQKAIANGSNTKLLVANAWFELYYVLVALDDIESARAALDTAIEMDPDNDTFLNAKEAFERRTQ